MKKLQHLQKNKLWGRFSFSEVYNEHWRKKRINKSVVHQVLQTGTGKTQRSNQCSPRGAKAEKEAKAAVRTIGEE